MRFLTLIGLALVVLPARAQSGRQEAFLRTRDVFPLQELHVHGSSVVELPGGDLLACWFEGSGERWADDVAILGSRLPRGADRWSEPFVLADVPGFPDINPVLFVDGSGRLWLFWYTVLANLWETSLLKYRISEAYADPSKPPVWKWQDVIHVKPGDPAERGIQPGDRFAAAVERKLEEYGRYLASGGALADTAAARRWERHAAGALATARGEDLVHDGQERQPDGSIVRRPLGYPLTRRIGWQTRNKPVELDGGRIVLPLYSDGFSFSLMAITDDGGAHWSFSEPLVGAGNIQPALALGSDGSLTAYMRDNGPPPKRLHVSRSADGGVSWSPVRDAALPNPGAGADVVTLRDGHWLLVYNDVERGRHSLAVSLSPDEGKSWPWTRRLELDDRGEAAARSHYPAVVEAADGTLHVVYSFHRNDAGAGPSKTIRHAHFNRDWVMEGNRGSGIGNRRAGE